MATSYAPVPDVPLEGLNLAESNLFKALKENVEILSGARLATCKAVTTETVTIQPTDNQTLKRVTAGGNGWYTSYAGGAGLPNPVYIISYTDYANLVNDVQNIANDVARLQNVVNSLIGQLQGR